MTSFKLKFYNVDCENSGLMQNQHFQILFMILMVLYFF